jgi:glutamine amidotransferase
VIAIIDYGAGNLRSVTNALVKLGYQPKVTDKPNDVLNATAVIFPGVGAAADAMQSLGGSGLDNAILQAISQNQPLLAICVGMQVLFSITEEGGPHDCLGVIPGVVKRLPSGLKVPHMGWNQVKQRTEHSIFEGIPDEANFYFVHSYFAYPENGAVVAGTTEYGVTMCSVLIKDSLVATQFHPEKSGDYGLRMYANFLKLAGVDKR